MSEHLNYQKNICLGMPLYNEGDTIKETIEEFDKFIKFNNINLDLLIVDDCSTDNSYEILSELTKKYKFLKVYKNSKNLKHGLTIFNVYCKISELNYEYIIGCDSDGQFNFNDILQLLDNYENDKLIIGSRKKRVEGGIRLFITKTLKLILKFFLKYQIEDANSPFRLFSVKNFNSFKNTILKEDIMVTNILISMYFILSNKGIVEVSIDHLRRKNGKSGTMWENKMFSNFSIYLIKFSIFSLLEINMYKNYFKNNYLYNI